MLVSLSRTPIKAAVIMMTCKSYDHLNVVLTFGKGLRSSCHFKTEKVCSFQNVLSSSTLQLSFFFSFFHNFTGYGTWVGTYILVSLQY